MKTKINGKKIFPIILVVTLVSLVVVGIIESKERRVDPKDMEEKNIMKAYEYVNYAFFFTNGMTELTGVYEPITIYENNYNIHCKSYIAVKIFNTKGSGVLSYEAVKDYFSQEYEVDGTLRLYNNGRHLEIEKYVEWVLENYNEICDYFDNIQIIYSKYSRENSDFDFQLFHLLSPQVLDELMKKESDPDYELDLLSLQKQGY